MASRSDVVRLATTRVLPVLVLLPLVARLIDTPPSSLDALGSLAAAAWITVLVRPLVVTLGFAVVLHAIRAHVSAEVVRSGKGAAFAIAVILGIQLIGSLFVQAAGATIGVPVDLLTGAAAALSVYAARRRGTVPSSAVT